MPARTSVIIPTLNEAATLELTLERLAAYKPAQVIVVDGGSRDATREIARRHGAEVLSAPRGRAAQLNAGVAAAREEMLMFLHADAAFSTDPFPLVRRALAATDVAGGGFSARYPERSPFYWWLRKSGDLRFRLEHTLFGDQAVFTRRRDFDRIGGFDESADVEDVDFSYRLARTGRLVLLPPVLTISSRRYRTLGKTRAVLTNQMRTWRWRLTRGRARTIAHDAYVAPRERVGL